MRNQKWLFVAVMLLGCLPAFARTPIIIVEKGIPAFGSLPFGDQAPAQKAKPIIIIEKSKPIPTRQVGGAKQ